MALAGLRQITRVAGTPLKEQEAQIVDIAAGEPITWLGYRLQRRGTRIIITIAPKAWEVLEDRLATAHLAPLAATRASQIIDGWLGYLGPCYRDEDRSAVLGKVRDLAAAQAFEEIGALRELDAYGRCAYARWSLLYRRQREALPGRLAQLTLWQPNAAACA